jgi:hypothetical protein
MRTYRVFFIKNGIKLTKLVYAESMIDVINMFNNMEILLIKEIDDLPQGEIDTISLN